MMAAAGGSHAPNENSRLIRGLYSGGGGAAGTARRLKRGRSMTGTGAAEEPVQFQFTAQLKSVGFTLMTKRINFSSLHVSKRVTSLIK